MTDFISKSLEKILSTSILSVFALNVNIKIYLLCTGMSIKNKSGPLDDLKSRIMDFYFSFF